VAVVDCGLDGQVCAGIVFEECGRDAFCESDGVDRRDGDAAVLNALEVADAAADGDAVTARNVVRKPGEGM